MNPGCPVKYKVDLTGDPELGIHNPGPFFDYGMDPFSCGTLIADQGRTPFTLK
jgi:hypothetical protein